MKKEIKEMKNKMCTSLIDLYMNSEDEEIALQILNIFNENDYLVSEATAVLESCIEALKLCPVIKYGNVERK